ncbi:MAG: hypothetical protein V8R12_02035 [Bacteroides faecis]
MSRCKENDVDITIFISPSYSIKGRAYKEAVVQLAEVANRYGYELMDFSSDERFMCDSTLFKDASHLNDRGARMYTSIVAEALKNKK